MQSYQVALSFAGEDREYVEQVAKHLVAQGVSVFYDKFEEATLWGKNLYTHLRDVYEKRAQFTVLFISRHYKDKVWPRHELESAQAKALADMQDCILPAFFDESIEVPGLLPTTGRISLSARSPGNLASLIVKKLEQSGGGLSQNFAYSEEARADVDFPRASGTKYSSILNDLKSHDWYTQGPAVSKVDGIDWKNLNKNEIFVLGRNLYQCACGGERKAESYLKNLREELSGIPPNAATHLLNGMFFEVYFDKKGEFRMHGIKGKCLNELLELQKLKRFGLSISFIRSVLQPYRAHLPFLPSPDPELVTFDAEFKSSDSPILRSLTLKGKELISKDRSREDQYNRLWKLSSKSFTISELQSELEDKLCIPQGQLKIKTFDEVSPDTKYSLRKGFQVIWPDDGLPIE
jgi:hypothetical protein